MIGAGCQIISPSLGLGMQDAGMSFVRRVMRPPWAVLPSIELTYFVLRVSRKQQKYVLNVLAESAHSVCLDLVKMLPIVTMKCGTSKFYFPPRQKEHSSLGGDGDDFPNQHITQRTLSTSCCCRQCARSTFVQPASQSLLHLL